MLGLIVLIGLIIIIILGVRHGDKKIQEAEKEWARLEAEREKKLKEKLLPKKVRAITTPVRAPMPTQSKLPTRKVEQRTSMQYTTTRAENSGEHSSDDIALGMLVGHLSSMSDPEPIKPSFTSGYGGDFGGGGASSSWDSSSSSSDSSSSDSSSSSSDDNN